MGGQVRLSEAQIEALRKFSRNGGHLYGPGRGIRKPTARSLERLGLVKLGPVTLGNGGRIFQKGRITGLGRAALGDEA